MSTIISTWLQSWLQSFNLTFNHDYNHFFFIFNQNSYFLNNFFQFLQALPPEKTWWYHDHPTMMSSYILWRHSFFPFCFRGWDLSLFGKIFSQGFTFHFSFFVFLLGSADSHRFPWKHEERGDGGVPRRLTTWACYFWHFVVFVPPSFWFQLGLSLLFFFFFLIKSKFCRPVTSSTTSHTSTLWRHHLKNFLFWAKKVSFFIIFSFEILLFFY